MDRFRYSAYDPAGSRVTGVLEAVDLDQARTELRARGLFVRDLEPDTGASDWRTMLGLAPARAGLAELEFFTSELSLLLGNGVRVERAISVLARGAAGGAMAPVLSALASGLKRGQQLSEAMAAQPAVFDPLYVNLVQLGEATGRLADVFAKLAEDLAFRRDLRQKVISAITYPLVILFVCIAAILFIFNFVVPNLTTLFSDFPELPWYTTALLAASDFMQRYQLLLGVALLALGAMALNVQRLPRVRRAWGRLSARLPLIGEAVRMVERIRFSGGVGMMLASGVAVDRALQLANGSVQTEVVRRELDLALEKVRRGEQLSGSLRQTSLFPEFYVSLLEVGEESGTLAPVFTEIARRSRDAFAAWTQRMTSVLEPLLILFMGVVVGAVVVVIMLSITSITDIGV